MKDYNSITFKNRAIDRLTGNTTIVPTADSTAYYGNIEYISKLKGLTATTKPEMDKQFKLMKKAKIDRYRQSNKGKAGYDKNGFPIKKG